jgi:hypothetical protein
VGRLRGSRLGAPARCPRPGAKAKAAGGAGGLLHAVVSLAGSLGNPTLASLDDESAARERHECQDEAERLGLEDRLHHQRSQRIPAPVARAIVASSMTAHVKRARFAFTCSLPSNRKVDGTLGSAAGRSPIGDPWLCVPASRRVCPGRSSSGVTCAARYARYGRSPSGHIARGYWRAEVLGSVQPRTVPAVGWAGDRYAGWPACRLVEEADRRIATTITTATPRPMRRSPTLKTLANGSHAGRTKVSVSGRSAGSARKALFE